MLAMVMPATHIDDAMKLEADGIVDLFELQPMIGGTIYFKPDNNVTWQGDAYVGIPMSLTGLNKSVDRVADQPRLVIGNEDIDLSIFKPLLFDGGLEGGTLVHRRVLLAHVIADTNISQDMVYRIKRPESYSRSKITIALSSASDAMNFTLPNKQYYPPAFPAVMY